MRFLKPLPRGPTVASKGFYASRKINRSPGNIPTKYALYGDQSSLAPTPSNLALIKRTQSYSREVATSLKPGIDSAREFLLTELFPPMLAMHNGMQDGFDVIKLMIGESPSAMEVIAPMEHLLTLALRIKMASFISKHASLSNEELETFMHLALENLKPSQKENASQYKAVGDLIKSLANAGESNPAVGSIRSPRRALRALNKQKHVREEPIPDKQVKDKA